ncbi:MAG: C4-dicarboxylate transporter DctA [Flavobacteriales bacterium]
MQAKNAPQERSGNEIPLKKPWYRSLYLQVLFGIFLGVWVGYLWPQTATLFQGLGDGFIALVKMMIAPLIFVTLTVAIANMNHRAQLGRLTLKTLAYFLFFSSLALIVGMVVGNYIQPGEGMNLTPSADHLQKVKSFVGASEPKGLSSFVLNIIPVTFLSSLTGSSLLQVLLVAILFGFALNLTRDKSLLVISFFESLSHPIFKLVELLMRLAPFGAFGAMAYTVAAFGLGVLWNMLGLVVTFYLTAILFIVVFLGAVCWYHRIPLFSLVRYLKEELLLVLATSSSESALPSLMTKLERLGCAKPVVGLVVPTGYSFNLDGTNIYITLATLFIAQACNFPLSIQQQFTLFFIAMLSSKGAAGVTGSGFITLAATVAMVPGFPVFGLALLIGVDKFMSECRAFTNMFGNAVATMVIAEWDGQLNREAMNQRLK